mgnify:CR=1 FL=1
MPKLHKGKERPCTTISDTSKERTLSIAQTPQKERTTLHPTTFPSIHIIAPSHIISKERTPTPNSTQGKNDSISQRSLPYNRLLLFLPLPSSNSLITLFLPISSPSNSLIALSSLFNIPAKTSAFLHNALARLVTHASLAARRRSRFARSAK